MNRSVSLNLVPFLKMTALKRGAIFGGILIIALGAFEIFNYSTTQFALVDVLGDLRFGGVRWAAILSVAFCGIDFAGIARLFTPSNGRAEPTETWYLFTAWLLAAGFNAILTWWGVSIAILGHSAAGSVLVGRSAFTTTVPIFIAGMVWLIRVLIIGTFSTAGEHLFTQAEERDRSKQHSRPAVSLPRPLSNPTGGIFRPAPKSTYKNALSQPSAEPAYHPVGMSAKPAEHQHTLAH